MKTGFLHVKPMLSRRYYKPFDFPKCYDAYVLSEQMHWKPQEVKMDSDQKDWAVNLSESEKEFLTQIFRFFVQADTEVCGYYNQLAMIIQVPEIALLTGSFQNREALHMEAYSLLINSLNLPESEFKAFLDYQAIRDKFETLNDFSLVKSVITPFDLLLSIAVFSAFVEGVQLFSAFAMLLNFQRHDKMKGMCQIVAWSILDETLHSNSMIALYHELLQIFQKDVNIAELHQEIFIVAQKMIEQEDLFIDSCFQNFVFADLESMDIKLYVRYLMERKLQQLGLMNPSHQIINAPSSNPLPWLDIIVNAPSHSNFFEMRPIEYGLASMTGDW